MKVLVLSSYSGTRGDTPDHLCSGDLEPPEHLEHRINELSDYSAPAGDMFTDDLRTKIRQGLKQIREHEQYGENTLDLYFPWYTFRVDRQKVPVNETDHIVPFNILPPEKPEALEYDETGFLESMGTLIEGYDLVLSTLRWQDIVRLQRVFEVERATPVIFLIARTRAKKVRYRGVYDGLPNVHTVYTYRADLIVNKRNHQGAVFKILCKAACYDGFHIFEQIKQDPQRIIEIARSLIERC